MHSKLIVQFEMKSIMVIKFNIGVFVFAEKIQVIKLGHHSKEQQISTERNWQVHVKKITAVKELRKFAYL